MRLTSQIKDLNKRIKKEKNYKDINLILPNEEIKLEIPKKKTDDKISKYKILEDLTFYKNLLTMINDGATGFELAYTLEKNQSIKKLVYDGILFYNTFLEIGNLKFIEAPDVMKKDYSYFKTIEDTEKFLFINWLKTEIEKREEILAENEDYRKYIQETTKMKDRYIFCQNCGAKIKDRYQKLCENCGFKLI